MTLSFPGAIGYGANTTGGRGGQVIKVTNSNDTSVGSLRWAIEDFTGPRIIIFDVNEVNLEDNISLRDGDVTIAGQTAGGVQVTGATVKIKASNVIMRGMMFRPGDGPTGEDPGNRDAMTVSGGSSHVQNIMIDHCSFEWAVDENVSFYKHVTDMTFSNNIVAQALHDSIHPKGVHSKGLLIGGGSAAPANNITISHNLFAFNVARNPRIEDGSNIEFVNNYIYGTGDQYRTSHVVGGGSAFNINFLNNFYLAGSDTKVDERPNLRIDTSGNFVYLDGNLQLDKDGNELSEVWHGEGAPSSEPGFPGSGLNIMAVLDVRNHVLTNAGANPANPDAPDKRILDFATVGGGVIVDSVADAGGYASALFTPLADADDDGIPDVFDDDLTDIEAYVNGLYTGATPPPPPPAPDPGPDPTLEAQIVALEGQVASLTTELLAALSTTAALQDQIAALEARIVILETPTADLEARIVDLEAQVAALTGQTVALQEQNVVLETQVVDSNTALVAANQKIASAIVILSA